VENGDAHKMNWTDTILCMINRIKYVLSFIARQDILIIATVKKYLLIYIFWKVRVLMSNKCVSIRVIIFVVRNN